MPCVGIFGIVNRFSEYEGGTSQGESRIDQETMSISTLVSKISVRDLANLTGRLSSTEMADLSAPLYYRSFQQQITGLSMRGSYEDNCVTQGGKNGTGLLDVEFASEQLRVHTAHCPHK